MIQHRMCRSLIFFNRVSGPLKPFSYFFTTSLLFGARVPLLWWRLNSQRTWTWNMCRDGDKGTRAHYSPLSMCSVSFRGCFMDKVFGQSIVYTGDRDSCKLNKLNFSEGSRSPPPLPPKKYVRYSPGWLASV